MLVISNIEVGWVSGVCKLGDEVGVEGGGSVTIRSQWWRKGDGGMEHAEWPQEITSSSDNIEKE